MFTRSAHIAILYHHRERHVCIAWAARSEDYRNDTNERKETRGDESQHLLAEAVEGAAGALESVDDIESSDGLALGVLAVGDGVTDDVLEEDLENTTGLLVDETRDTLHTTTTSETADHGLGNTLDVIAKNLAVTLGAALAKTLATFTTARHS